MSELSVNDDEVDAAKHVLEEEDLSVVLPKLNVEADPDLIEIQNAKCTQLASRILGVFRSLLKDHARPNPNVEDIYVSSIENGIAKFSSKPFYVGQDSSVADNEAWHIVARIDLKGVYDSWTKSYVVPSDTNERMAELLSEADVEVFKLQLDSEKEVVREVQQFDVNPSEGQSYKIVRGEKTSIKTLSTASQLDELTTLRVLLEEGLAFLGGMKS